MPKAARKYSYYQDYATTQYPYVVAPQPRRAYAQPPIRQTRRRKKVKRANPVAKLISLIFLALIGYYVLPYGFHRISKPLFLGQNYKNVKTDYYNYLFPTTNYLANDSFLNQRSLKGAETKNPKMTPLYATENMPVLEAKLKLLMKKYPSIHAGVYVWEFENGKYVGINDKEIFSAASIIKIPVLVQLFKSIEANQFTIYDEMVMTNPYKASGSGNLQYMRTGSVYTFDKLAKVMIEDSDNTATNMIVGAIGSMTDVNEALRQWGLKNTYMKNWLPDLGGENYSTPKDMATILYNLDNPGFLNINSREYIIDYMSHVKNNRLIQAGLGKGALFVHKTGDIGKTLGDAGIVYTPSGQKYIVVIFANRPYNSALGSEFIREASKTIYDSMTSGKF